MRLALVIPMLSFLGLACTAKTTEPPEPPGETCSEASPICDPGCSANEVCLFADAACGCELQCNSTAPACAGSGPNNGCETGFFCDTSCSCVAEIACIPDAPACDGNGPNNGCAAGFVCNGSCACEAEQVTPAEILARPSRSTAIDISKDDLIVAMVNTDLGSLSLFNATKEQESRSALIASSNLSSTSEPQSVVIAPDQTTAFVANRATGSVSRIVGIDTLSPELTAELEVGGEPMGLALSPTGASLWVTNWVNGNVSVIDVATFSVRNTIELGGQPFAIAITNDGDQEDDDEKALITQFYARKNGNSINEGSDSGRVGIVHVVELGSQGDAREIQLAPRAVCFESPDLTSGCFPNQLYGITIHEGVDGPRAYVVSVGAAPAGPVVFNHNVQALISVIDVENESELTALTSNLNTLIKEQQQDTDGNDSIGRRFISVPNAIDFVNRNDVTIGYVTSAGSDVMLRVEYPSSGGVIVGAPIAFNIATGESPQGLVVKHSTTNAGAFTANLIGRNMSIIGFRDQVELRRITSTDIPTDPRSDAFKQWKGKRFFNTSTGIWSKEGWGSCQGCHPFGLTDNVTWQFAAGPRQTISLDGQYASNDAADMRALNWTAIFDETADFELNVRGVSGGRGAIQNADGPIAAESGPPFAAIAAEDGTIENHQALNGSLTFVARNTSICTNEGTCPDWDLIDAYIQSIRSPRAATAATADVESGRVVFEDAGCNKCHAGPKWTVSRRFFQVDRFAGELPARTFDINRAAATAMDPSTLVGLPLDVNTDTTLVAGDDSDGGAPALKRQACNIRNVQTFAAPGGAEEVRANGQPAQGQSGFNPPSLLGASLGAPYLHNGAAASLEDLFDARFARHFQSGNPNFNPTPQEQQQLIRFLRAIDETTVPFDVEPGTVLCPSDF